MRERLQRQEEVTKVWRGKAEKAEARVKELENIILLGNIPAEMRNALYQLHHKDKKEAKQP